MLFHQRTDREFHLIILDKDMVVMNITTDKSQACYICYTGDQIFFKISNYQIVQPLKSNIHFKEYYFQQCVQMLTEIKIGEI